jgi:hypothetical protein
MIEANTNGPWVIDNTKPYWAITNTQTGQTVKIGPVQSKGINYFDRAMTEANKRNQTKATA